ncbi:MAG: pyruvate dehydrogenase (acetyl-transferring) E1 component subunit alpha [Holosporales bacterium]|jgi:pyruvate dehydrogenase E1 component alpha subunit|nr:pyruvate dehydrogenase (acetyl-transferring) E1 component subunit alpha [Holosporales bacterium]
MFHEIDLDGAKDLYRKLVLARFFEEQAAVLYSQGHIYGFCHLYIGQEAVIAGLSHVKQPQDSVVTSYRDHAHMLALGVPPNVIMAELCGRTQGCSRGKGGSMHMYCKERNFYGGNGIVGAQVSIGAGLAFAHKYNDDGGVAFTFYGDGAANQGQVFEAFNMASLWKLPVVFVLENNHYALGTAENRAVSGSGLSTRGDSFGIPTIMVDGMDVFDVIKKSKNVIEKVRCGDGPVILHMDTYRYKGHSMSDPANYRSRDEVENIKKTRDPILNTKKILLSDFGVSTDDLTKIENETKVVVETAARFAIESSEPDSSDLEKDVIL